MRNIIISFIAVGGAVFYDFFVADLSAAMTIALALTGLLAAATKGDVKEIRRLIKNGENPNQADENGLTALILAAIDEQPEAAQILLDNGIEPNQANKIDATALMGAAFGGQSEAAKVLLDNGAEPNQANKIGWTALMGAAAGGHSEAVKVLLDNGANPNQADENERTALMGAVFGGHSETAKVLLDNGAAPNQADENGWTALMGAAGKGHSEAAKVLLDNGTAPNQADETSQTALMSAAFGGHSETAKVLLDNGAEPNQADENGQTALMAAAFGGHSETARVLLDNGADLNQASKNDQTALMSAAVGGHSETAKVLLDNGAEPNQADEDGWTALIWAAIGGHSDAAKVLLDNGATPNQANKNGMTALMSAAIRGHSEAAKVLLDNGANPNQTDENGGTILMRAAFNGQSEAAKVLLDNGATPNQAGNDGWTALMSAAFGGHSETAKVLLDNGAEPNQADENGITALMSAANDGHSDAAKVLLDNDADPNQAKKNGWTALMSAAWKGHSDAAKVLLDGKANPDQTNNDGRTALIHAAFGGHSETAKVLLDGDANPNQAGNDGRTALMHAALGGHSDVAKILLDGKANPNQADNDGMTALMGAESKGHSATAKVLLDGGASPNQANSDDKNTRNYAGEKSAIEAALKQWRPPIPARRKKLARSRAVGAAYPNDFQRDRKPKRWRAYADQSREALQENPPTEKAAGRIALRRDQGKAIFVTLQDGDERIQLYLRVDSLGAESFARCKEWGLGDIVCARGTVFKTRVGELSLRAEEARRLAKALRLPPEKFHGLVDVEERFRRPYLALMSDENARAVLQKRGKILRALRKQLKADGYLEVETPILQPIPGGAAAKPFSTHHHALSRDLFLRVAQELHLKRLLVGGFERVFEIGRNFRNEGISPRHNPEFTMLEFNAAYCGRDEMIAHTERLVHAACGKKIRVARDGQEIDFSLPFARLTVTEAICQSNPNRFPLAQLESRDFVVAQLADSKSEKAKRARADPQSDLGALQLLLFEEVAEESLTQPTFVVDYPASASPLARRSDKNPAIAERFELFAGGMEIANGFAELNDPEAQAEIFKAQAKMRDDGDDEAMHYDADYIEAMEYAMPPNGGGGIGIDRLVMLLAECHSIREAVAFPQMRPRG